MSQVLPRVFISCVSDEFRTLRRKVEDTVRHLGYEPVTMENWAAGHGELLAWLRAQIDSCEGLIQITGHAYGAEPPQPQPAVDGLPERYSYTQFEFLYAQATGKKTWIIQPGDACTRDTRPELLDLPKNSVGTPDPSLPGAADWQEKRRAIQTTYLERLRAGNHLRHKPADDKDLQLLIHTLRDHAEELRQKFSLWQDFVSADLQRIEAKVDQLAAAKPRRSCAVNLAITFALVFGTGTFLFLQMGGDKEEAKAGPPPPTVVITGGGDEHPLGPGTTEPQDPLPDPPEEKDRDPQLVRIRDAVRRAEAQAEAAPRDPDRWRDLAFAQTALWKLSGDPADRDAAVQSHRRAIGLIEMLATTDPADRDLQMALAGNNAALGELALAAKIPREADFHFDQALEILERLASAGPEEAHWLRGISYLQERLGEAATASGDDPEARRRMALARQAREAAERASGSGLMASNPDPGTIDREPEFPRLIQAGSAALAEGNLDAAESRFRDAFEIAAKLAADQPGNPERQRDAALAHSHLAGLLEKRGQSRDALLHWEATRDILEKMNLRWGNLSPQDRESLKQLQNKLDPPPDK